MSVSVVVPTYYRVRDLSELLDTILRQTVKPLEVIVVDDTPTNVVRAVCENYATKFSVVKTMLVYVKNPKERSSAISRNLGARAARGDIVMFFDSDVALYPDYIEQVLAVFEEHPSAQGVQGWHININMLKTNPLIVALAAVFRLQHYVNDPRRLRLCEYPYSLTKTVNCECMSGSNFGVRRYILAEFWFDERLKKYSYLEDLLFSHTVYRKYPDGLYITPHAMCLHKQSREARAQGSETWEMRQSREYVLSKLFGGKGLVLYFWQTMGVVLFDLITRVLGPTRKNYRK
jgi:glycosyltransferase involved in cell wall biosynthesis